MNDDIVIALNNLTKEIRDMVIVMDDIDFELTMMRNNLEIMRIDKEKDNE